MNHQNEGAQDAKVPRLHDVNHATKRNVSFRLTQEQWFRLKQFLLIHSGNRSATIQEVLEAGMEYVIEHPELLPKK